MWFIRQFVFRIDGAGHRLAALVASCAALFLAAPTALLSATAPAGTEPSPSEPAPLWSHVRGVADLGEVRDLRPEWDANVTGGTLRLVVTDASPNRIEAGHLVLDTRDGEARIRCDRIIARMGSAAPRKFIEECGIQFTSPDREAFPTLSPQFESTNDGIYVIGALAA